eukprot:100091-Pyramimonas_sp.AAC.1
MNCFSIPTDWTVPLFIGRGPLAGHIHTCSLGTGLHLANEVLEGRVLEHLGPSGLGAGRGAE